MAVVVGIDLAAGRGVTEVAALEVAALEVAAPPDEASRPLFLRAAYHPVQSDAEIVGVVAAIAPTVVAIDAPLSLPAAVMRALDLTPRPPLPQGEGEASPYLRAAERDPIWGQLGMRPLPVSFLGGLTFRALVLLPRLRATLPDATIIEVFPSATHAVLYEKAPGTDQPTLRAQREKRGAKTTTTTRRQRQITLARRIEGIPTPPSDADDAPKSADTDRKSVV